MALGFTLHSILRGKKELPVNSVQEFADKDFGDMVKLGAIRTPTESEISLYKLANPSADDADEAEANLTDKAAAKAAKKAAKEAAAKETAEKAAVGDAAAGDADPEVTDPLV